MTLAFRCLLRASNYCKSVHSLPVKDIVFVENGIVVKIQSSKTNQFNEFISEIPVYVNGLSVICPVTWIKQMLAHRTPGPNEPLFMLSRKRKWVPMSASWFNVKLREVSNIPGISSHGLRKGGATHMLQNKVQLAEVKKGVNGNPPACISTYPFH